MKYSDYNEAYVIPALVVPAILNVAIFVYLLLKSKEKRFIAFVLDGIVTRRNFKQKPKYFICEREILFKDRKTKLGWLASCLLIIQACAQLFLVVSIIEISYKCLNDSNLECFEVKNISDVEQKEQYPVNCSTISSSQVVVCFRVVFFDAEKFFLAVSSAYLLFKILKVGLMVIANLLFWLVKISSMKIVNVIRVVICFVITGLMLLMAILSRYVKEFESAARKLSYVTYFQMVCVTTITAFACILPLNGFQNTSEYLVDVSLVECGDPTEASGLVLDDQANTNAATVAATE